MKIFFLLFSFSSQVMIFVSFLSSSWFPFFPSLFFSPFYFYKSKELGKDQNEFKKGVSKWLQPKKGTESEDNFEALKKIYWWQGYFWRKIKGHLWIPWFLWWEKRKNCKMLNQDWFLRWQLFHTEGRAPSRHCEEVFKNDKKKLLECFKLRNNKEELNKIDSAHLAKTKAFQTQDSLSLTLARNYSPLSWPK